MPVPLVNTLKFVGNLIAALLVAYLFMVVLMTAAAQQRVSVLLDRMNGRVTEAQQIDYSSAWAKVKVAKETADKVATLQTKVDPAASAAQSTDSKLRAAARSLEGAWAKFAAVATRLSSAAGCPIPNPLPSDPTERMAVWTSFTTCLDVPALDKRNQQSALDVLQGGQTYGALYADWERAKDAAVDAKTESEALQAKIADAKKDLAQTEALQAPFNEMNVLTDTWMLGGGLFIEIPPSMMQIILAFFSGLFGALLVTVVLVVYPKSKLSASASGETLARVFLGGLISLGVYIILGGGAAVLGNATPFDQSQANFMTFSAVGVLAGMFSDRVAYWLSERANAFFGSGDGGGTGSGASGSSGGGKTP